MLLMIGITKPFKQQPTPEARVKVSSVSHRGALRAGYPKASLSEEI
jgi:hypothetical protein